MRKLPPLNSLRAFEAAARHLSFTEAGAELLLTQSAISQQIKTLETALGVELFERRAREIRLTRQGKFYAAEIQEALRIIVDATTRIGHRCSTMTLTLSCVPSFAHKWLMPRLGRFVEAQPDISLRLHTSFESVDFARDGIDSAVRDGSGDYPGLFAELLFTEELTPMCCPEIARKLTQPSDLKDQTLLQDFGIEWEDWFRQVGLDDLRPRFGPEFLDSSMAIRAAIDGRGIILGRMTLAQEDLESGLLVAPFNVRVPYDVGHWFVCPEGDEKHDKVRKLLVWLKQEASLLPPPTVAAMTWRTPSILPYK